MKHIEQLITGESKRSPYRKGREIVDFFVELGVDDFYDDDFPGRSVYTLEKLVEFNTTTTMRKIVEAAVDRRDYLDPAYNLETTVNSINVYLAFDGYELVEDDRVFRVRDTKGILVEAEAVNETEHERVHQQIAKCQTKIEAMDYDGAITNARTMLEEIMIKIIEEHRREEVKNSGDLLKLYKEVRAILNLNTNAKLPATVLQILSGLSSITSGLAGLSNEFGDRHAHKNTASKHHAKLAVNAAMTLADFLIDSKEYQNRRSSEHTTKTKRTKPIRK